MKWLQRKNQLIPTKEDLELLQLSDPFVHLSVPFNRAPNANTNTNNSGKNQNDYDLHVELDAQLKNKFTMILPSNQLFGSLYDNIVNSSLSMNDNVDDWLVDDCHYYADML